MKALPIVLLLVLTGLFTAQLPAQVLVDGLDINKVDYIKYCQLVGQRKGFSNKITVVVDYGQATKLFGRQQRITGRDGKNRAFNSMIDALNFMEANGWEFVSEESVTEFLGTGAGGSRTTFFYLLRRRLNE